MLFYLLGRVTWRRGSCNSVLPSRNEIFFCTTDLPHSRYPNAKTKRLLGWEPQEKLTKYYLKPAAKL